MKERNLKCSTQNIILRRLKCDLHQSITHFQLVKILFQRIKGVWLNKFFEGSSKSKSSRINEWVLINKSVRWYKDHNVWKNQWTDGWNNKKRILIECYAHVTKRQNAQKKGKISMWNTA
jgi:hypothetical protein